MTESQADVALKMDPLFLERRVKTHLEALCPGSSSRLYVVQWPYVAEQTGRKRKRLKTELLFIERNNTHLDAHCPGASKWFYIVRRFHVAEPIGRKHKRMNCSSR